MANRGKSNNIIVSRVTPIISDITNNMTLTQVRSLSYNQLLNKLKHPENPVVFMDIIIGNTDVGRISFELFADVCPLTSENFRQFCTGDHKPQGGPPRGYRGTKFHRVVKDFMVQGGDFVNQDGTGYTSIYNGVRFKDENFDVKHDVPGILSMANSNAPDTNGCQFFITTAKCDFLDNQSVAFGRVVDGMLVLRKMENVPVGTNDKPRIPIVVANCGEL